MNLCINFYCNKSYTGIFNFFKIGWKITDFGLKDIFLYLSDKGKKQRYYHEYYEATVCVLQ